MKSYALSRTVDTNSDCCMKSSVVGRRTDTVIVVWSHVL